jgi:hypothetical protein
MVRYYTDIRGGQANKVDLRGFASPENVTMLAVAKKLGFTVGKCSGSDLSEMQMTFKEQIEAYSISAPISWR